MNTTNDSASGKGQSAPMERTYHKNSFRPGLSYDDPDYRDAYELSECNQFFGSAHMEKDLITNTAPIESLLDECGEAMAAFYPAHKEYRRLEELCRGEDGYIRFHYDKHGNFCINPILDESAKNLEPVEAAYWKALERLNTALEVEMIVSIREALTLAGVTDTALAEEICRCVIRGGSLNDGDNLRQRGLPCPGAFLDAPAAPEPKPEAGDPLLCPHCGNPTDPDKTRCPFCERLIG